MKWNKMPGKVASTVLCVGLAVFGGDTISLRAAASGSRPNIIIILGDDMGQGDLGCYNAESRIPTPNMDRVAREGTRFTDAHSGSAVCSPTRYGLLTGRYAWRTSLKRGVLRPYDPPLIEKGRLTLPALLQQNGYTTACIFFSLTSPHEPIQPSERFRNKSGIAPVADFIMETDWAVGHVLNALDALALTRNTLLIFAADNGPAWHQGDLMKAAGQHRSLGWRSQKGNIYEGGHRIPFIARWPEYIRAGRSSDALICLGDMMATVAALLEVRLPDDAGEDSVNILPVLVGDGGPAPQREAIVHHDARGSFAIREGSWKLIQGETPPPTASKAPVQPTATELYNLAEDPGETADIHAKHPEVVAHLSALLERYSKDGRSRE